MGGGYLPLASVGFMLNYHTSVNAVMTLLCGLQEEELTVHNTVVMKGFVEILVILWYNISAKLQEVRGPISHLSQATGGKGT